MIDIVVEGDLEEIVATRILDHLHLPAGRVFGRTGRTYVLDRIANYNQAANYSPWVALVDLEGAECAPRLLQQYLPAPSPCMRLRVAVRSTESWLMADSAALAEFLHVSPARIPIDPEAEASPKEVLVNIARHSRSRAIREAMVPRDGSGASEGPLYATYVGRFALAGWRLPVAVESSESLRRCVAAFQTLAECI